MQILAYVYRINKWRINGGGERRKGSTVFLDSPFCLHSRMGYYNDTRNFARKSNGKNGELYSYNEHLS